MHFVNASIYHKAKQLASREGVSPDRLAHHDELKEIQSGAKYIPIELLFEVYEMADGHLGPKFSVSQGKQLNSEDYGTLGLSWRTCWKAKEVLDRIERFMVLVTDHGSIGIEENAGITKLKLFRDANRRGVEMANEVSFVMIAGVLNEVTGKEIVPVRVGLKHSSTQPLPFENFFKCPVEFDQEFYFMEYRTKDIDIPTIKADQSIHQFLVDRMDEEKRGIHSNADQLLGDIHKLVTEALPSGLPSVIQVADYLGMSARTLKRRLADKNLTFRDFVQNIQRDVSINLIKNTTQSMAEIAFQTGFSEQSAFNRAFKRWTGKSPVDYRKTV